jgi:ABC-type sugar transport system permease subunit
MRTARKMRAARKRRRTKRILITLTAIFVIASLFTGFYYWFRASYGNQAFQSFTSHYMEIMSNLNSSDTKTAMNSELVGKPNFTDLFQWEHSKLTFGQDPGSEDPVDILASGTGICEHFSIVYVSACLALGYQSRLVVAVNTSTWTFIHVWAEDYFNGNWIHVDPSDKVWNNPLRYLQWDWGKYIGANVRIYAFEDGNYTEVTPTYE